jgi:Lon-like protease
VDQQQFLQQQREIFRQSQTLAAAAAAEAAGLHVTVNGGGVRIEDTIPSSPAAGVLEPGDIITAVDGRPIRVASDLQEVLTTRPAGTSFEFDVERDGRPLTVQVKSRRLEQLPEGGVGVGVVISTVDFQVDLPFNVDFRERNIGGPSAGLAYALAITDMLEPGDFATGRTIGATGTIDVDGEVGAVGGVREKAVALVDSNADVFLVPEQEVDEVATDDIDVQGVSSLREALRLLGATGST